MSLKKLAKNRSDVDIKKELELLKQRQKDIKIGGYFTAFTMEKIRNWEKKRNKIKEVNLNE